jgi:hypothetical protein
MKVHPFVAAPALLLVAVTALSARLVVQRHAARARPGALTPESPVAEPPFARRVFATTSDPWPAPVAGPAPPARAALRVRVTGPHGLLLPAVSASAVRQGDAEELAHELQQSDEDDDGTLLATELPPGRYDVVVEGPGLRTARVTGLLTGGEVAAIALDRAPLLLGSIGEPGLAGCAGTVSTKGLIATLGDDCTFAFEDVEADGPIVVTSLVAGHAERALVTLPLVGDPGVVCLAPPCTATPASLAIYVADAAGRQVERATIEWTLLGDDLHGELGSAIGDGFVYIHGRRPGQTLELEATVDDRKAKTTVVVGAGVTEVVLTVPGEVDRGRATPPEARRIRPDDEEAARPPSRESARERGLLPR